MVYLSDDPRFAAALMLLTSDELFPSTCLNPNPYLENGSILCLCCIKLYCKRNMYLMSLAFSRLVHG